MRAGLRHQQQILEKLYYAKAFRPEVGIFGFDRRRFGAQLFPFPCRRPAIVKHPSLLSTIKQILRTGLHSSARNIRIASS